MNEETPAPTQSNAAPVNPVPPAPGPAAGATTPPPAAAPVAKPTLRLSSKPMGSDKEMTNQQISGAVKMPSYAKQFSSPMPNLDENADDVPGWAAALAGLAAVAAVACAILLSLKN